MKYFFLKLWSLNKLPKVLLTFIPIWQFCRVAPDKIIFKKKVINDLLKIVGKLVLKLVCRHTHFGNAAWIRSMSATDLWLAFLECWSTVYAGHSSNIYSGRESGVNSRPFQDLEIPNKTELQLSHVEAPKEIGFDEKYNCPLRSIYKMLQDAYATLDKQLTPRLAVKSMNNCICLEPLGPPLLFLGSYHFHSWPVWNFPNGRTEGKDGRSSTSTISNDM